MLSSPITNTQSSALQTRQRLHRRQKSMPVPVFEAMKMSASNVSTPAQQAAAAAMQLPSPQYAQARAQAPPQSQAQQAAQLQRPQKQPPPRQMSHRRGLSLDTRRQQLQQRQQKQKQSRHLHSQSQSQSQSQQQSEQQQQQRQELMAAAAASAAAAAADTNQGQPTTQQHDMRETQQQRTVRQGASLPFAEQSREEALLAQQQQQQQQQQQRQQQQDCSSAAFDFYNGPTAAMMRKTLSSGGLPLSQHDFQFFAGPSQQHGLQSPNTFESFQEASNAAALLNAAGSPQGWASEDDTSSTRRVSRRVSNGILDRVAKFETMTMEGMPRPATPPLQNDNVYFPPTPTETPLERMAKHSAAARLDRFSDNYDESMEETLKPVRRHANHAAHSSGVFDELRQQAEAMALATPTRSTMMPMPMTPADFMALGHASAEILKLHNANFVAMPVPADMQHLSPPQSQQPTPATSQGVFDGNMMGNPGMFDGKPDLWATEYDVQPTAAPFGGVAAAAPPASPSYSDTPEPSSRRPLHRRNESVASVASTASAASAASAASIASINIDETRTETGVTTDDIALYIDGPNPVDGKWRCLYESCGKRFGRKENIKSHVQTHLNDRQYQCPHCHKCFVRQHDLKRHAKIHTGIKPYPCECGNNFARHDALTRHRQRGMCIGAFDGAVRKIGKRGRPRKLRPDMEERRDKSSRTRSKNKASASALASASPEASSFSGYSDNSTGNSPQTDGSDSPFNDDMLGALDNDMLDMGFGLDSCSASAALSRGTMNPSALAVSSAPMPGAGISAEEMVKMMPVVSPSEHAAALAASPSAMSHYSYVSRASLPGCGSAGNGDGGAEGEDLLPANHPGSPAKSVASHYTLHPSTPPELSASSSPPQSSARFFDLDPNSSSAEDDSIGLSAPLAGGCGPLGMDVGGGLSSSALDDDIMLMKAFAADDVLVQLDNSGLSMLNTSKFDDDYGMFTNSDDVFFGTS